MSGNGHINIPDDWTPEQAEACLHLLEQLMTGLWDQYEAVLGPLRYLAALDTDEFEDVGEPDVSEDVSF